MFILNTNQPKNEVSDENAGRKREKAQSPSDEQVVEWAVRVLRMNGPHDAVARAGRVVWPLEDTRRQGPVSTPLVQRGGSHASRVTKQSTNSTLNEIETSEPSSPVMEASADRTTASEKKMVHDGYTEIRDT